MEIAALFLACSLIAMMAALIALVRPNWVLPGVYDPTPLQAAGLWVVIMFISSSAGLFFLQTGESNAGAGGMAASAPAIDSTPPLPAADFTSSGYLAACGQKMSDEDYNAACAGKSFAGDVFILRVKGKRRIDIRPDFTTAGSPVDMQLTLAEDAVWDAPPTGYFDAKIRVTGTIGESHYGDRHDVQDAAIIGYPPLSREELSVKARHEYDTKQRQIGDTQYQKVATKIYPACISALNVYISTKPGIDCPWFTGIRTYPYDNGVDILSICNAPTDESKWTPFAFSCKYENGNVKKVSLSDSD